MALKFIIFSKRKNKLESGQSFIELLLVFPVLMILLAGMVEFGYMLNQYINLIDGVREGARFGSDLDPFFSPTCHDPSCDLDLNFFIGIDNKIEGILVGGNRVGGAIKPTRLNSSVGDDIVISFFSVSPVNGIVRYPISENGRSIYSNQTSRFTTAQIEARLDPAAPKTGLLLVEVYFHYFQLLKLYTYTGLPDPVEMYTYSIMPLSASEPTADTLQNDVGNMLKNMSFSMPLPISIQNQLMEFGVLE
jgi:hypothetical protein